MRVIKEGGLSRLWQHTQNKNGETFAIIGCQDKDTKELHKDILINWVQSMAKKGCSYKYLEGTFTYSDGTLGVEPSVIIFNVNKQDALDIAKPGKDHLNQESIIWKDDNYFGFLTPDGVPDGKFSTDPQNMTFSDVEKFGSRLAHHHNINQLKKFAFKLESVRPSTNNSIKALGGYNEVRELIEEWYFD